MPAAAEEISAQITEDIAALNTSRNGLRASVQFLEEHPDLVNIAKGDVPSAASREALLTTWQTFLDHLLALDVIGTRASRLYAHGAPSQKDAEYQLAFAAFAAQYHYALAFLHQTERSPALHVILNEPLPELGVPAESYAAVKFRFLNIQQATRFAWFVTRYRAINNFLPIRPVLDEDINYITKVNEHKGITLTVRNAGWMLSDALFTAWFPVQKEVSEWMGDTKVLRKETSLISEAQLHALQPKLEPGDILLVRREWYLSNIGLPGFWPHAALYIGTPDERRSYFGDISMQEWVKSQGESSGNFEKLLLARDREHYRESETAFHGDAVRVIEAISEGVSFTSLEHAAGGDSLVVLRPQRTKQIKARAIMRAFHLADRPYDFDFNFLTDSSLVCTELVYKAYEGEGGLALPLETVMGRPVLPANRIASLFDEEYDTPSPQLEFVAFYDGQERSKRAVEAGVDEFRASWRRPKWHIFIQSTPASAQAAVSPTRLQ